LLLSVLGSAKPLWPNSGACDWRTTLSRATVGRTKPSQGPMERLRHLIWLFFIFTRFAAGPGRPGSGWRAASKFSQHPEKRITNAFIAVFTGRQAMRFLGFPSRAYIGHGTTRSRCSTQSARRVDKADRLDPCIRRAVWSLPPCEDRAARS
jgi:hypothetical protein